MKTEMQRLGIPEKEGEATAPTAAQTAALEKAQAAARDLARVQQTRQQLRQTEIAFHDRPVAKGEDELPAGGVDNLEHKYEPVSSILTRSSTPATSRPTTCRAFAAGTTPTPSTLS